MVRKTTDKNPNILMFRSKTSRKRPSVLQNENLQLRRRLQQARRYVEEVYDMFGLIPNPKRVLKTLGQLSLADQKMIVQLIYRLSNNKKK